jgi:peptidoglycan/xylan/chitin deacetylase (PgdA/CDA1 family)
MGSGMSVLSHHLTSKNKLTVFCYHDVSNVPGEFSRNYDLNIPPAVFYDQVKFIKSNFDVISPDQLINEDVPENAAMITFDDGLKSYFTEAVPILTTLDLPSIIFLNMAPVEGEIFWSGLITYLCEKEPQFIEHLQDSMGDKIDLYPLYLNCSIDIIKSYQKLKNNTYQEEVKHFVGPFASEGDLVKASSNPLVYFGNHLYNHYLPKLLSDEDLIYYYEKNENALKNYTNYRKMFSFPFGQPETCFTENQIALLLDKDVKKIFSGFPRINQNADEPYLDRISLYDFNDTAPRMWFNILRDSFRL